jgi:lipid A 3-O-deacylase
MIVLVLLAAGHRAQAQISFGSPDDPPRVAIGGGAFDVIPESHPGSGTTGLVLGEFRFGDKLWILSPFIGAMGTGKGAVYTYVGFGFDVHFPENFILTPSFAGGYFGSGHGIDLGYWWEFRSGAELAYRFSGGRRIGVGFYHISNAGLGNHDPGAEFATFVLTAPF